MINTNGPERPTPQQRYNRDRAVFYGLMAMTVAGLVSTAIGGYHLWGGESPNPFIDALAGVLGMGVAFLAPAVSTAYVADAQEPLSQLNIIPGRFDVFGKLVVRAQRKERRS